MKNHTLLIFLYFFSLAIFYSDKLFAIHDISCDMTNIIFIRHGRTDWNDLGRIQGHSDIPLNTRGHNQAADVATRLFAEEPVIDAIYSSDLQRAVATAEAVNRYFDLEIKLDPRLRETFMGQAEGIHEDEFSKIYPSREDIRDAESRQDVLKRVQSFLVETVSEWRGKTIVLVSHGDLIRTLIKHYHAEGSYKIPNCSMVRFKFDHNKKILIFEGITP